MYPRGLHQSQQRPTNVSNSRMPGARPMVPNQRMPMSGGTFDQNKIRSPALGGPPGVDQRHKMADKLIADCYSKIIIDKNGKKFTDTSYQTHVSIKEYSSFPSHPPPDNLPPQEIGSIKDRILVICVKHSGRVLIQKGKFNSTKNVFQIGRTWDMDELKTITKVGDNGIILSLNKDYYWKIEEGLERVWKFARFLTSSYGGFMGRYPSLRGFTLQDFKLPPVPAKKEGSLANRSQTASANTNPSTNGNHASPQIGANEFYKGFDFTSNGKLPMKPMKVMQSDRPSNSDLNRASHDSASRNSDELRAGSRKRSSSIGSKHSTTDSQSFVFKTKDSYLPERIHEYNEINEEKSESSQKDYHEMYRKGSSFHKENFETLESSPALGISEDKQSSNREEGKRKSFKSSISGIQDLNQELGIEEVSDDSEQNEKSTHLRPLSGELRSETEVIEESTKLSVDESFEEQESRSTNNGGRLDNIDSSIQEIEDFMDSQLYFGNSHSRKGSVLSKKASFPESIDSVPSLRPSKSANTDETFDSFDNKSLVKGNAPLEANFMANNDVIGASKDPELEEFLDDVGWTLSDDSSSLLKKLLKERNKVKHQNIRELINLDFREESESNDFAISLSEVESLGHIFKKMEIDFRLLSSDVNLIENNSKGLQVKSVNKKLLYNDLKNILGKVSIGSEDLHSIESFNEFDRLGKLEGLEQKLVELFNALSTIQEDSLEPDDDLSSMSALKQYCIKYENVARRFVRHFVSFFTSQFDLLIKEFSEDVDKFYPSAAFRELNNLLIYSSFTYFMKGVSADEFQSLSSHVNKLISIFLESLIKHKVKNINSTLHLLASFVSQKVENSLHERSRSLRFSRREKHLGRATSSGSERGKSNNETSSGSQLYKSSNIDDPRIVVSLVEDTKNLIWLFQYFIGSFFHFNTTTLDFIDYLELYSFLERRKILDIPSVDKVDQKSYSENMITTMNLVFGSYINIFMKKVTPAETNIPSLLVYLDDLVEKYQNSNQEFLVFNFLKKVIEKFKTLWQKFMDSQIDILNKSTIIAKCGILPGVKNISQLLLATESSLEKVTVNEDVNVLMRKSYQEISIAASHLFMRDDPLLKSHDFDDKEREHRNVSVIQNVFFLLEQLSVTNNDNTSELQTKLEQIFQKFKESYFQRLLHKNIGKMVEFVDNYEALDKLNSGKPKKYNKKYVKTLLANYSQKDISLKALEIYKKLEKHYINGNDMFEKDLLDSLWSDMEQQFISYFTRLNNILRSNFDKDIDINISSSEIHTIFKSIH
ncbi:uncharacterized protein PRCAT00002369001 [Priceomyces carsonii]|uniref:uncharacterized protein n=1 Tax=Priceomyces carsonii TaxID=28549 RepID=UPI002EDAAAC1|nr:unnamed protein product [Priceomyces carsonii]